jgi:proline iminopeptidase
MGCGRAGWYSYDRLDNGGTPSARSIVPELQNLKVGDILPSRPSRSDGFEVLRLEPPNLLILGAYFNLMGLEGMAWGKERPRAYLRSTWVFIVRDAGGGKSRLVVRARTIFRPRLLHACDIVFGPGHVLMQRKQLLNLKTRAEGLTSIAG